MQKPSPMPRPEWSLRRRIGVGLFGYSLLLTAVVLGYGFAVHESAEQLVWKTLLQTELGHFLEQRRRDPGYAFPAGGTVRLYEQPPAGVAMPVELVTLAPGVHDEVEIDGRQFVVLAHVEDGRRFWLTLNIDALEAHEQSIAIAVALAALLAVLGLSALISWGVGRLTAPLRLLAARIEALRVDAGEAQQIAPVPESSQEISVIRAAMNDYLQRNHEFMDRERAFIDLASHELRTPVAVIRGAAEVLAADPGCARQPALARILATTRDAEQLIAVLLVLARDPQRVQAGAEPVALAELLPRLIEDHRHLCQDRDLEITLQVEAAAWVQAPPTLLAVAIGNLLRNAIEHSDRGQIVVRLGEAAVCIEDPGHGMSAEEISRVHARHSRRSAGSGIGLDLIGRLCDHLGWQLRLQPRQPQGTSARLSFGPSDRPRPDGDV